MRGQHHVTGGKGVSPPPEPANHVVSIQRITGFNLDQNAALTFEVQHEDGSTSRRHWSEVEHADKPLREFFSLHKVQGTLRHMLSNKDDWIYDESSDVNFDLLFSYVLPEEWNIDDIGYAYEVGKVWLIKVVAVVENPPDLRKRMLRIRFAELPSKRDKIVHAFKLLKPSDVSDEEPLLWTNKDEVKRNAVATHKRAFLSSTGETSSAKSTRNRRNKSASQASSNKESRSAFVSTMNHEEKTLIEDTTQASEEALGEVEKILAFGMDEHLNLRFEVQWSDHQGFSQILWNDVVDCDEALKEFFDRPENQLDLKHMLANGLNTIFDENANANVDLLKKYLHVDSWKVGQPAYAYDVGRIYPCKILEVVDDSSADSKERVYTVWFLGFSHKFNQTLPGWKLLNESDLSEEYKPRHPKKGKKSSQGKANSKRSRSSRELANDSRQQVREKSPVSITEVDYSLRQAREKSPVSTTEVDSLRQAREKSPVSITEVDPKKRRVEDHASVSEDDTNVKDHQQASVSAVQTEETSRHISLGLPPLSSSELAHRVSELSSRLKDYADAQVTAAQAHLVAIRKQQELAHGISEVLGMFFPPQHPAT